VKQRVYLFSEVAKAENAAGDWEGVRALLGGKGAQLAEMSRIGVLVPPGFTITTEACKAYLAGGETIPPGLWEQVTDARHQLETLTGRRFGNPANPLLVSCRSGARFSMPGMMDTVLNIGLNDTVAAGIAHDLGTAVNIVAMVFGNLDADSATGVVTTRNATHGEPELVDFYVHPPVRPEGEARGPANRQRSERLTGCGRGKA